LSKAPRSDLIVLGTITKPHGIKGEVKAHLYHPPIGYPAIGDTVRLKGENELDIQAVIENIQLVSPKTIIKFKEINNREDADSIRSAEILAERDQLPELKGDDYYLVDLIGLQVLDENQHLIGRISDVLDLPANDVLVVVEQDNEYLIPLIDDVVKLIDFEKNTVTIHVMDGLLDG